MRRMLLLLLLLLLLLDGLSLSVNKVAAQPPAPAGYPLLRVIDNVKDDSQAAIGSGQVRILRRDDLSVVADSGFVMQSVFNTVLSITNDTAFATVGTALGQVDISGIAECFTAVGGISAVAESTVTQGGILDFLPDVDHLVEIYECYYLCSHALFEIQADPENPNDPATHLEYQLFITLSDDVTAFGLSGGATVIEDESENVIASANWLNMYGFVFVWGVLSGVNGNVVEFYEYPTGMVSSRSRTRAVPNSSEDREYERYQTSMA